jgi:hypothetical protein
MGIHNGNHITYILLKCCHLLMCQDVSLFDSCNFCPQPTQTKEEVKNVGVHKDQELLFDVMNDLKELNHLSSGGSRDSKVRITLPYCYWDGL